MCKVVKLAKLLVTLDVGKLLNKTNLLIFFFVIFVNLYVFKILLVKKKLK